ncbi:MAG: hypothetical protein WD096_04295 [Actinomycetota bacterium]
MDEYSALAQRVAMTMEDVRGCLLLSRDGLVLGAYPEDGEASLKSSWLKFVGVGDARRSFVEFGDQIWAYIHRGPYAAFVVGGASIRPGVLLDQLEQALLVAEEARQKRDALKVPDAAAAPSGKPRTSLHPPADRPSVDVHAGGPPEHDVVAASSSATVTAEPTTPSIAVGEAEVPSTDLDVAEPAEAGAPKPFGVNPFAEFADGVVEQAEEAPAASEPVAAVAAAASVEEPAAGDATTFRKKLAGGEELPAEQPGEIDRVMLAKEFSGLLQLDSEADEDSS